MEELPITAPDDINSMVDLLKYAWVVLLYWGKQYMERLKALEEKMVLTPTLKEVEDRVDKELARVIIKLDRMEALILGMLQTPHHRGIDHES